MHFTISLVYDFTDESKSRELVTWHIEAGSLAEMQHLLVEDIGSLLRRTGQRMARAQLDPGGEFEPTRLQIYMGQARGLSIEEFCKGLSRDDSYPEIKPSHVPLTGKTRFPVTMESILLKHGFLDNEGRRRKEHVDVKKKSQPDEQY